MGRFLTCAYLRPRDASGGPLTERLTAKLLREGFEPVEEPADRWLALLSTQGSPWVFLLDSDNAMEDTGVSELRKEARKLAKAAGSEVLYATVVDSDAFAVMFCGDGVTDIVVRDPGGGYGNLGCGPRTGKGKPALWQAFFGLSDEQTQALRELWQGEFVFAEAQLADMFTLLGLDAAGLDLFTEELDASELPEGSTLEVLHFRAKTMSAAALYRKRGEELLLPLGFQRHKNRFWRVADDVYQSLHFLVSEYCCHASFSVQPFCMELYKEIVLEADCDPHHLKSLSFTEIDWSLKNHDPETIAATVDSIVGVVQSGLIPFFERASDCTKAYEELRKLYQLDHTAMQLSWNWWRERFFMLLKLGRLDEAREFRLAHREERQEGIRRNWDLEVRWFGEEKATERKNAWLAPIDADIELTKHPEQVRQLIAENERKSRAAFGLDA